MAPAYTVFEFFGSTTMREMAPTDVSPIGFQLSRTSTFSIWGQHEGLEPLKLALSAATALLAVAVYFVPRMRDTRQVAALAGAILVALQLTVAHWFYFYLAWLAPLVLVAILAAYRPDRPDRPDRSDRSEGSDSETSASSTPTRRAVSSPAGV